MFFQLFWRILMSKYANVIALLLQSHMLFMISISLLGYIFFFLYSHLNKGLCSEAEMQQWYNDRYLYTI